MMCVGEKKEGTEEEGTDGVGDGEQGKQRKASK